MSGLRFWFRFTLSVRVRLRAVAARRSVALRTNVRLAILFALEVPAK